MDLKDYQGKTPLDYILRGKNQKKFERVFYMLLKIKYDFFKDDTLEKLLADKLITQE